MKTIVIDRIAWKIARWSRWIGQRVMLYDLLLVVDLSIIGIDHVVEWDYYVCDIVDE